MCVAASFEKTNFQLGLANWVRACKDKKQISPTENCSKMGFMKVMTMTEENKDREY